MKKILVIDDDQDILDVVTIRLQRADYEVIALDSGEKGLKWLEGHFPDLIFLDLLLPGIQGEEICRKIKSNTRLRKIPVILLTASSCNSAELKKETGADDCLQKPFEGKEMLAMVKKFLGSH
jgi:DNA-binding response OmpR family regulator